MGRSSARSMTPRSLPLFSPSGSNGFLRNCTALGGRKGGRAGLPALGRSEAAQGQSGLISGIWLRQSLGNGPGSLLNNLPRQLIRVTRSLGHMGIFARREAGQYEC